MGFVQDYMWYQHTPPIIFGHEFRSKLWNVLPFYSRPAKYMQLISFLALGSNFTDIICCEMLYRIDKNHPTKVVVLAVTIPLDG